MQMRSVESVGVALGDGAFVRWPLRGLGVDRHCGALPIVLLRLGFENNQQFETLGLCRFPNLAASPPIKPVGGKRKAASGCYSGISFSGGVRISRIALRMRGAGVHPRLPCQP